MNMMGEWGGETLSGGAANVVSGESSPSSATTLPYSGQGELLGPEVSHHGAPAMPNWTSAPGGWVSANGSITYADTPEPTQRQGSGVWIFLAVMALLVGGGAPIILVALLYQFMGYVPGLEYLAPVLVIAMVVLVVAVAPTTPRRRALSLIWFIPLLAAFLIDSTIGRSGKWLWFFGLSVATPELLTGTFMVALFCGGWFTLRGRPAGSYAALIAAPVLTFIALMVGDRLIHDLTFSPNLILASVGLVTCLIGGLVRPTRFDSIPQARPPMYAGVQQSQWPPNQQLLPGAQHSSMSPGPGAQFHPGLGSANQSVPAGAANRQPAGAAPWAGGSYGSAYNYYASPTTSGVAVASLILGILGVSPLAVIFGHVARSQVRRTGQRGAGMAMAGLVLGYIGMAVMVVFVLLPLVNQLIYY